MAAPRKLPPDEVLIRWFDEELTHEQMVEEIRKRYGRTVRRETVANQLAKLGRHRRPDVAWLIPWKVPHDFAHDYPVQMLRAMGRVGTAATERGEGGRFQRWYCSQQNPDPGEDAWVWGLIDASLRPRAAEELKRFIAARRREGNVVYLDLDGWKYVARRPGRDLGLTRDPGDSHPLRVVNS